MGIATITPARLAMIFAVTLLNTSASAQTQTVDIPSRAPSPGQATLPQAYRAEGYGRARFGMSVDEVKALAATDYPGAAQALKDETDPLARTRTLTLDIPALTPGPGAAAISYVFGASSHRLIAVNVIWLVSGKASKAQQVQLIHAAAKLASGFVAYQWPLFGTTYGKVLFPGVSVVFAGHDNAGGGVEVRLEGVAAATSSDNASVSNPAHKALPPGPASLRLTLVANSDHPDIYRIPAGAF